MACTSPLRIPNPHFKALTRAQFVSDLKKRPWHLFLQYITVPCGHCEECLRELRNNWYVRCERELAYARYHHKFAYFVTLTIHPNYYESALEDPSLFIRKHFERHRHLTGTCYKHFLCQEFGKKNSRRLHFHGIFISDSRIDYQKYNDITRDLGHVEFRVLTERRCRYIVKYILKGATPDEPRYGQRRYRRRFVSAHFGDYLGDFRAPSFTVNTWSYTHPATGSVYTYSIPRYYRKYSTPKDETLRNIRSAYLSMSLDPDLYKDYEKTFTRFIRRTLGAYFPERFKKSIKLAKQNLLEHPPRPYSPNKNSSFELNSEFTENIKAQFTVISQSLFSLLTCYSLSNFNPPNYGIHSKNFSSHQRLFPV